MRVTTTHPPVIFVTVPDPGLLSSKVREVIDRLDIDPTAITYWDEKTGDLSDALQASSLFNDLLLIVIKEPDAKAVKTLTEYCSSPSTDKILLVGASKPLALFRRAVKEKAGGQIVEVAGKYAKDVVNNLIAQSAVSFHMAAQQRLIDHVGEDVSQVPAILEALSEFYPNQQVKTDDLSPFLSVPGEIKPWTLTDAIDRGAAGTAQALDMVGRLYTHQSPVGIVSLLKAHIDRIWRLQQAGITNENEAAQYLGMKGSTYPAKKAIQLGRVYGSTAEALLAMVAEADAALRGGRNQWSGIPPRLILEILVARMCSYPRK